MKKQIMKINKSSHKKMSISIIVLFSISLILIPLEVYADEINVASTGIDETAIITVTNNSDNEIKTFRVWLGEEFNFKSFKTEKGWTGEKNQQGVIIFTSSETLKPNEQVKFGLKTDKINPIINWKALDKENKTIDTGVIKLSKLSDVTQNSNIELNQNYKNNGISMFAESTFRVIPDKPNSGSTIRITGDQFAASQQFNFYIDTEKIGNFITDSKGHFVTTMQIPNIEEESRVDFKIIGHDQIEKKISLKLGEKTNRILGNENVRLEVRGIPDIAYQGDELELEGTGTPGKSIIIEIINPEKTTINSRITTIENTGTWKLLEPISIPLDAQFGEYSVSVSDGRNEILKKWTVKTNKVIIISPEKIQFDAGELIKFTGTAVPNIPIELILENNVGDEIASDIIEVADSGLVEFEYQTTENDDIEGTWTLIATQKNNKEFVYVGYDVFPTIPVNIKFDKINYKNTEKPIVSLAGIPSEKVSLIIITPSGSVVGSDITIQLKADGRGQHSLDLSGYVSGIYTAVVKKGGSQNSENFSVGLLSGSGQISSKVTQTEYNQGERILLLGSTTNPNSLMTVTLTNPDGKEVKTLEIASNSEGMFSEERLKIPSDGKTGSWEIMITSGSNLQKIQFDVFSEIKEGMTVKTTETIMAGDLLKIDITASHKTSIIIQISNAEGDKVQELMCNTTKEYKCETFWSTPKDTIPGTYNIKAYDAISSSETTFKVIMK
ncbi:MAG: biofilm-associated protein [Nitrosopumilus sp.]|nr:biofilm-associated protein [Nitrosopumilus sp.]MDC4229828.1 biofilm-associated protein [Nitrosopumilus sp.]